MSENLQVCVPFDASILDRVPHEYPQFSAVTVPDPCIVTSLTYSLSLPLLSLLDHMLLRIIMFASSFTAFNC